jgi:signal transduction histidine kinase
MGHDPVSRAMTTRTRILLACLAAAVIPLMLFVLGARHSIRTRLIAQYDQQVAVAADALRQELRQTATSLDNRLASLSRAATADPRHRAALAGSTDGTAIIDFAVDAMAPAGLDLLLLLDSAGTVLSSGHFRNDYGRDASRLRALSRESGPAIVHARRPAGEFNALARTLAFAVGGRAFLLVAGVELDPALLASYQPVADSAVTVSVALPGGASPSGIVTAADDAGHVQQRIALTYADVDANLFAAEGAGFVVTHSLAPLGAVLRAVDRWIVAAIAAALVLAFLIARLLAVRVNRPLEQLARQAERVDIDRHDVHFTARRRDEVGSLARVLNGMVQRLRTGAAQLRDAERRATVGDMARQVNHDIRNGLLPIRNVIHHLGEVASETPAELASVFTERQGTLSSGIGYLESLATNYARLSPRLERQNCSVNAIAETVLRNAGSGVRGELSRDDPRVHADPVALRRIIENLVVNAVESLSAADGRVTVRTAARADGVVVEVEDNGAGMRPDVVERIFDDFYTTKERGTGLGLSIVRRLVADMGGRIHVRSEPGAGTTFTIELPGVTGS